MGSYNDRNKPEKVSGAQQSDAPLKKEPYLILLAEDNAANVVMISSYLKAKGFKLVVAKNGLEAIELLNAHPIQLILMDIQMPEMDGLEATKAIRENPENDSIPIIALTALAMDGDREKCLAAGADEYLSKPVKLKKLSQLILQFLAPKED